MINKYSLVLIAILCSFFFGFGQSIFTNPITGINPSLNNPYTIGQIVDANITVSGIGRILELLEIMVITDIMLEVGMSHL